MAIDAGADALGLVSRMPSGPGVIDEATIAQIAAATPPPVATFLLTSETDPQTIVAQARRTAVSTVQIVDHVSTDVHAAVRTALPALRVVQVVHVVDEAAVEYAVTAARGAHALLLDSGNPGLARKELGGTGRVHDWSLSRSIVDRVTVPVFLAGGLHPGNVVEAVKQVRPFGVDVCSGLRRAGRLDQAKLARFAGLLDPQGEATEPGDRSNPDGPGSVAG